MVMLGLVAIALWLAAALLILVLTAFITAFASWGCGPLNTGV